MIPKYGDRLVFADDGGEWHNGTDYPPQGLTRVSWASNPRKAIAWVFFGHVNLDFDGSPTAYGPQSKNPDDWIGNAGDSVNGWYGVASMKPTDDKVKSKLVKIDPDATAYFGKYPVVQQERNGDPNDGYYVSSTPHPSGPEYLQSSYVDASAFPFSALSRVLLHHPYDMSMGDFGVAIRHDDTTVCPFYFEDDAGDALKIGECSHKVGLELGCVKKGIRWDNNFPVSFIIFPHSAGNGGHRIPLEDAQTGVKPFLKYLGLAANYFDLALLMGFNEIAPQNRPPGLVRLNDYLKNRWKRRPLNIDTIYNSLQGLGWAAGKTMPAPDSMMLPPSGKS